ncbi:MAG: SpoIVB peptidase S55 domain-containing protein, partial [Candidatus Aminicenantes bacterium]
MRKLTPINIISIILMVLSFSFCLQAVEIMKLSEIRTGMEGVGKSTLKGTQVETYTFKVLGIIENFAPKKNLIIVKLDSPELNSGGVVSGMSGSPAYIDDKLIGAIAYGFVFSRQPIGGITPIEDILQTAEYETPTFTIDISTMKVEFDKKNLAIMTELVQDQLTKRLNFTTNEAFSPIRLIGIHRGFKPAAFSYLRAFKPVFSLGNGAGITPNTNTITTKDMGKDLIKISPADTVSI